MVMTSPVPTTLFAVEHTNGGRAQRVFRWDAQAFKFAPLVP